MSTIPAAVLELIDVCKVALPDARVDDGPTTEPYERDADGVTVGVTVGWDEDGPGVEADLDREMSDAVGTDRETYRIYCTLIVSYGDPESPPLRTAAFEYYEAIKAVLRQRHPLVPDVLRTRMMTVDYEVRPGEGGWEGRLRFAAEVTAFDR